ncbi:MAG: hypothetical protein K2P14_11700 [Anaeroplasmataceae bacterium]|nr:hypothetical protein [Anaeroplasmataceae bacterium]
MTIESAMIKAIRNFNKKKLGSIRDIFPMEWGVNKGKTDYVGFQIAYVENSEPDCPHKIAYEFIRKEDLK